MKASAYFNKSANTAPCNSLPLASARICDKCSVHILQVILRYRNKRTAKSLLSNSLFILFFSLKQECLDKLFLLFNLYSTVYVKGCQNHFVFGFKRI